MGIAGEQDGIDRRITQIFRDFFPASRGVERNTRAAEGSRHVRDKVLFVRNQQHVLRVDFAAALAVDFNRHLHNEAAALMRRAFDADGAAHQVDDVLCNRHAEAGALHLVGRGVLRAGERLENVLDELGRHAVAVIGHGNDEDRVRVVRARLFREVEADFAADLRILDRVREQVDENLPQTHGIANEALVADLVHADSEGLPARFGLRPDDAVHLTDLVREIDLSAAERGIARLDFAHVEHIVDKAQQMLTGALHLADVLLELFGVVLFVRHQARDAHDGIHRGADVMRHIGKELALGAACVLRSLFGAFRRLHRLRKLLIDLFERLTVFPFQFERLYCICLRRRIV